MADMEKELESKGATRDESLSIEDILNEVEANNKKALEENSTSFAQVSEEKSILPNNPKENNDEKPANIAKEIEDDGLTPLEKLRKQREKNSQGLIVKDNKKVEKDDDVKELKNFVENDDRMADIQERIDEFDDTFKKRDELVIIKELKPNSSDEMKATAEIESVQFDAQGNAIVPENLEFFRKRDKEHEDIYGNPIDKDGNVIVNNDEEEESKTSTSDDPIDQLYDAIPEKNKKIAEILIDKTGLGAEFHFTEEEKEKITESDEIRLREIQVIDINAIRAKSSNKSYTDLINTMDTSGTRTPMAFPASGYSAHIKGMSFGEYTDVALDIDPDKNDYGTFDQNYKRLSILYNKIANVSCGSFPSFEEFLKQTSWTDIDLGLYGLLISTESEQTSVPLICGNCRERFDHNYSPRSLIQFKLSGYKFMERWKDVVTSPPSEYDNLHENSLVSKSTSIELPKCKYVVEVGVASAYEYLYNFIAINEPERFHEEFGDDENDSYRSLIPFLLSVKTIFIPDNEGGYVTCEGYKEILEALYNIPLDDMRIVSAYTNKYLDDITPAFAFTNAECPHCHHKMRLIPIDMNELVFQAYRHSMSITIDSESIQEI